MSLALSLSLNFASFPVRIPVQSSVLSANDTVTSPVLFFAMMAVDYGDEIPSKSKPQPTGITSCTNLLSFHYFVSDCHESSTNLSVCKHFSSIFSVSVPELLFNF